MIPTLGEQRLVDLCEFKVSQSYIGRLCLKTNKNPVNYISLNNKFIEENKRIVS